MPSEIERLPRHLLDIIENADAALRFIGSLNAEQFMADEKTHYAVVRSKLFPKHRATSRMRSGADTRTFHGAPYVTLETYIGIATFLFPSRSSGKPPSAICRPCETPC
jgi:hypothetical protein